MPPDGRVNPRRMVRLLFGVAIAAFTITTAAAQPASPTANSLDAIEACRAKTDPTERLACLDAAAAALSSARERRDVIATDPVSRAAEAKAVFGRAGPDPTLPEIDEVQGVIAAARKGRTGKWTITLVGGAVWRQTEANYKLGRTPAPGIKVEIEKRSLGSHFLKLEGGRAVPVKRVL